MSAPRDTYRVLVESFLATCGTLIMFSLQWIQTQALIKALGDFLDMLGGYFVLRSLIHDQEDVRRVIKVFALVAIIMGVGAIEKRPKVISGPDGEDTIAIRTCSYFSISFDHRLIDGAVADEFLAFVKKRLETTPEDVS